MSELGASRSRHRRGGADGVAAAHALAAAGCRVALVDLAGERLERAASEVRQRGVPGRPDFDRTSLRLSAASSAPRRSQRPAQQRGRLVEREVAGDRRERMAPRARGQSGRRVLPRPRVDPGDEAASLGPHRQHQFARREDRRIDRRHCVRGIEGRIQCNDVFARARARRRRRDRQRHRTGVRAHADGDGRADRSSARRRCLR